MEVLIIAVAGLLAVAAAATLAPRLRIAAPLILVVVGIGVSFLPFVPAVVVDPEWILAGILPPLLYSASVSMPTMNFRRDFAAISGLSVVLVVISAVILGLFFTWVIPGLSLWWGIALGAIVSPTDAVATSIVKQLGVSGRVVSVLEGESLLNDATALVLLRTAIAGTAASVSLWSVFGSFVFAIAVAAVIGVAIGHLNLWVRSKVTDSTVNTVLSFTVPFLASIPSELLGASGLVAAVIAGLITGHNAARRLSPQHRLSDSQNWHMIELVLEGAIFLIMGLELAGIVTTVQDSHSGIGTAALVAGGALLLTLIVRAGYVAPLLASLLRHAHRGERSKPRLNVMQERLDNAHSSPATTGRIRQRVFSPRFIERMKVRTRRALADIDYLLAAPLGWRDGGILVWAGMRGAITLAAAQTLPGDTPHRALLVLIAFVVAAASLLIQGGTLSAFVHWIKPDSTNPYDNADEREALLALLKRVADDVTVTMSGTSEDESSARRPGSRRLALSIITAQRIALLDARDEGSYAAESLNGALLALDAAQISIELRGAPPEL
ncbi:MAG: sodium:proton antiporter [Lacisediminihabitans sp.]